MDPSKWKRKADALLRLAEDQEGTPEGDLAREKLATILRNHPEAKNYEPLQEFMLSDLGEMRRQGISLGGSWTGRNLEEAVAMMIQDYRSRKAPSKELTGGETS